MNNQVDLFYLDKVLLKPSDVAKLLNISRSLAYRLLQNGTIPVVRINSAVRVRAQDLESFIKQHKSGAADWDMD